MRTARLTGTGTCIVGVSIVSCEVKSILVLGVASIMFISGNAIASGRAFGKGIDFIPRNRQLGLTSTSSQICKSINDALICERSDPDPSRPFKITGVIYDE